MSRFDTAAAEWDKGDMRQQIAAETATAIRRNIPLHDTMELLDFGAGTGLLTYRILPHVRSLTAVDTSAKMLEVLQRKSTPGQRIETACRDITKMPLNRKFDGIISSMAMHHVEDTAAFLAALYEHLRPGGFIALADLDKEDGSFHTRGNEGVFHFGFDRDTLRETAKAAGFSQIGFDTVLTIRKSHGDFPVFLMTACA